MPCNNGTQIAIQFTAAQPTTEGQGKVTKVTNKDEQSISHECTYLKSFEFFLASESRSQLNSMVQLKLIGN